MARVNEKEIKGVMNSADKNRYKYFIKNFGAGYKVYLLKVEGTYKEKLGVEGPVYATWLRKEMFNEFNGNNNLGISTAVEVYSLYSFYREVLTELIRCDAQIVVMPNVAGEGFIIDSKELKINIFKEIWESEQEKWVFKLH